MNEKNNKLIAIFMGFVESGFGKENLFNPETRIEYTIDQLEYHFSWNELIPVLAKLNKLCVPYMTDEGFPKNAIALKHSVLNDEIKVTYNCVITILKWYNKNKINE